MYLIIIVAAIAVFYFIATKNFNYWKKRGVKFVKPIVFYGSMLKNYFQKVSLSDWLVNLYRCYPDEKYVGLYVGTPALLLRDPELIKHVFVTDFKYFHNRGFGFGQLLTEPLMQNILAAEGDLWKLMRQKLTPAFSIGKLKAMFPLIVEQAEKLLKVAEELVQSREEIDIRELMARYTTDFIVACGFGINSDALSNESSEFLNLGKQIFNVTPRQMIVALLKLSFPNIFKKLKLFNPAVEEKIVTMVKQVMSERNYMPSGRNDFIDIMLNLRQQERLVGESIEEFNPDGSPKTVVIEMNDVLLAAQVFIFFAAGFETSYSSSIFLHVLAYHPEEQARCQQEIDEVLARYDWKLSYDSLKEMKYLGMAFKESMRILTSPPVLLRKCTNKYTFPGTNLTIDEGVLVLVSSEALHLDEQFFEDPEKFKPERFHPDNIGKMDKNVYLTFGDGPRACIGERMGVMQSLAGAASILSKFTVAPSKNSIRIPRTDHHSGVVKTIVGGLPLSLKLRE